MYSEEMCSTLDIEKLTLILIKSKLNYIKSSYYQWILGSCMIELFGPITNRRD